jgi:hypothetical protein
MRAVAHGFKPDRIKGPSVSVAQDFVAADQGVGARGESMRALDQKSAGGYAGKGFRRHTAQRSDVGGNGSPYSLGKRRAR